MKAAAPRADDGSIRGSKLVASGAVRPPDEVDALSVDLTIDDFEVTMSAGRAKIGSWLRSTVRIRRIDDASFEFIAEGDRLVFVPEDPATFGHHPAVGEPADNKLRRRREKQEEKAAKKATKQADAAEKAAQKAAGRDENRRSRRAPSKEGPGGHGKRGAMELSEEERSDPALNDHEAATEDVRPGAVTEREPASGQAGAIDGQSQAVTEPATEDRRRGKWRRRYIVEKPEADDEGETDGDSRGESDEHEDDANQLWIRALDTARKYDLFGLDRVPIDEKLRGQEHEHTWDHRVAVESGVGNRICTICGKIRR